MSRQNYYKERKVRGLRIIDDDKVVELVKRERKLQPRIGTRKLHVMLEHEFVEAGIAIGRDRLFEVLRANNLLIKRRRSRPRTTESGHGMRVYPNLLKDAVLSGPGEAVASDITYIDTDEGFMYLALTMDMSSHAVVGWDCSDSLESVGAMRALGRAISSGRLKAGCIHHSDRGCQYASKEYVRRLKKAGLKVSMTEVNHCYENAAAERLNGILKQEYGLGMKFLSKSEACMAVRQAVDLYNWRRPHMSLGYRVPMSVHAAA